MSENPFGDGPFDDDSPSTPGGEDGPRRPDSPGSGADEAPLDDILGGADPSDTQGIASPRPATPPPKTAPPKTRPASDGGGLLDDLRHEGEEEVSAAIGQLERALKRVDDMGEAFGGADVSALQSEWREIEADLKRALQSGLAAARQAGVSLPKPAPEPALPAAPADATRAAVVAEEIEALEAEIDRKNELIAQLTESVNRMNRELDERERSHRLELRGARDRLAELDEEASPLRERVGTLEAQLREAAERLELALEERDDARRTGERARATLESETALQDERAQRLEDELQEVRKRLAELETRHEATDRRARDMEKRLSAAQEARDKAEAELDAREQAAGKAEREAAAARERAEELEKELASETERLERELREARQSERRLRADADRNSSRLQEALSAMKGALTSLAAEATGPADDAPDDDADGGNGPSED